MGFECAIAIVIPLPSNALFDFYPLVGDEHEVDEGGDIPFFDKRVKVLVPAREWRVVRFIDFGRVRALVKSNSSLSPEQRASGSASTRAAICTASFLIDRFFDCEREVLKGNHEFVVPFIADHLFRCRHMYDIDEFNYNNTFTNVFERQGGNDVVRGLWKENVRFRESLDQPPLEAMTQGAFWEYNQHLLRGDISGACTFEGLLQPPCGLVWHSAHEVMKWMTDLLVSGDITSRELQKDLLSVAFVRTWRDTLRTLAEFGARVIFLTGQFHTEARQAICSQDRYL